MSKEILWEGVSDNTGYGIATLAFLRIFARMQYKIQWRARRQDQLPKIGLAQEDLDFYSKFLNQEVSAKAVRVQHNLASTFTPGSPTRPEVGYSVFEAYSVPPIWVAGCRRIRELWTPSNFSKMAFVKGGVSESKVAVIPHFVDAMTFKPGLEPLKFKTAGDQKRFRFLSIFEFTARKHWKTLLNAWWHETYPSDGVELIVITYRKDRNCKTQAGIMNDIQTFKRELGVVREHAPVYFYGYELPRFLMPHLYNSVDAYVGVSCEGFGLPFAEAAASELPIIAPAAGGVMEFLDDSNAFLVPEEARCPITDSEFVSNNPFFKDLTWPHFSVDALRKAIRQVLDSKPLAREKAILARKNVQRLLNAERIGQLMEERLDKWQF